MLLTKKSETFLFNIIINSNKFLIIEQFIELQFIYFE